MIRDLIVLLSIAGIALGRIPYLRMNRASIAFVGAVAVVAFGGLPLEKAAHALDLETLVLLFSMMVISVNLQLSGFFRIAEDRITRFARTPRQLLALILLSSGIFSAFFLNDTVVLMFTPLVTIIVLELQRNPIPYLIGLGVSANIGSAMTIIGNPQNMMIGVSSRIDFFKFLGVLSVPSLLGLAVAYGVIVLFFREEFAPYRFPPIPPHRRFVYPPLLWKSLTSLGIFLLGILLKVPLPFAGLLAASFLLVTRRIHPEKIFNDVDWSLLVLFAGLFVLIEALDQDRLFHRFIEYLTSFAESNTFVFSAVAAVLSNLVSNVPAVMLLKPGISLLAHPEKAWITLAMASTYAGNFTLLGSIANLIVAESAKKHGVHLGFFQFLKVGVPLTILTILMGAAWIEILYHLTFRIF
jgi:Na+/H+ antiporter NhaD/arsenite permease-like protein